MGPIVLQHAYREHILNCEPKRTLDGRYQPRLVVMGGAHKATAVPIGRGYDLPFDKPEDAVQAARLAGQNWVDDALDVHW
jgi:hypothetical protein